MSEQSESSRSSRLRVVVVDDEETIREVLKMSLQLDDGFSVVGEAGDGEEAVRVVEAEQPDMVVLDLMMPGTDGFSALPRIRECAPDTQIIVLSALPESETGRQAVGNGADGYLEKGRAMSDLPGWLHTLRLNWEATHSTPPIVLPDDD